MAEALIPPPPEGFVMMGNAADTSIPPPPSGFVMQGNTVTMSPHEASGALESLQAGLQGSVSGLAWRGKVPDMVLNPQNSKWWERALSGIAGVGGDLPAMIVGGALGASAGGALGTAAGPVGTAAGAVLGTGAGMFGLPGFIRESLMQAYKSGDAMTGEDWWNAVREVATTTAKDMAVGAVTLGAGGIAARTVGKTIAPLIGESLSVPAATASIGTADVAAQIAAMTTMPAAFQGRLPTAQEFLDGAIVVGGLKVAHVVAPKLAQVFVKTGKTPAEVAADVSTDPIIGMELRAGEPAPVEPMVTVYHGSPHTFDEFSTEKIGTGEGAQAYGHGLYFADQPSVAGSYKTAGQRASNRMADGLPVDTMRTGGAESQADNMFSNRLAAGLSVEDAKAQTIEWLRTQSQWKNEPDALNRGIVFTEQLQPPAEGNHYKVEIPQRVVDTMLNWDKPLSEQSDYVKKQLGMTDKGIHKISIIGGDGPTVSSALKALAATLTKASGITDASNKAATDYLASKGIGGIRYLDAGSRDGDGTGTRNYVLFDAKNARIVERNGKPMTMADIPAAYEAKAVSEAVRQIVPDPMADEKHALNIAAVLTKPFGEVPVDKVPNYLNFDYVEGAEDMRAASARISEIFEQQIEAARSKESWEKTKEKAEALLVEQAKQDGKPLTIPQDPAEFANLAAKGMARLAMSQRAAFDVAEKARKIEAEGATEENTRSLIAAIETSALMQAADQGFGAEIARALNARKAARQANQLAEQFQELQAKYGNDPTTLAKMIGRLNTPEKINKFAKDAAKATTWEKIVEAWKAAILSGPVTQMANLIGNTTFLAMRPIVDATAAVLGKLSGSDNRVAAAEPMARLLGNLQGAKDALVYAGELLATAYREEGVKGVLKEIAIDKGGANKSEALRPAIEGVKGHIIRLPFRALSVADEFFKTLNERGELATIAAREATREGLNPLTREFRERMVQIMDSPDEAMQKQITEAGLRFTFNTQLGDFGRSVQNVVRADPFGLGVSPLQFIVPFIRTPLNILKELTRLTPFAPLVKEWRSAIEAGGAERHKALSELALGTGMSAVVIMYAMDSQITGQGSPDPGKNRVKAAAGWQPYSIKIGDTYYNYQRIQPVGTLIGMAADVSEVWYHMTDEEMDKVPKMLAVAFANAVTNQTFLQGITNMVNAASDPRRFGPKLIQQYAGSVVPAIVAQPTTMNDPVVREVNSMLDAIKSRIPGARETLLPKIDPFGQPVETKTRLGGFSPVTESTVSDDKVRTEAERLDISIASAPKKTHIGKGTGKVGDVELTPEERNVFATVGGKLAHTILSDIVSQPNWDATPDLVKKRIFQKVLTRSHVAGAAAALPPAKREAVIQEISEKMTDLLQPEEVQ